MTPIALTFRAWAEMTLLASIWGASFLAVKVALGEVSVFTLTAHRVFWAALLLWAFALWRGLAIPRDWRTWGVFAVMGTLNNAIPFTLIAWGQQFIETGLTSIFNAATAVFAVLVAAVVFADERLTLRRGMGVAIAFIGVATAIGLDALRDFDIRSAAQLATLGGAFSYACAAVWARGRLGGHPPEVAALGMLTASSALLVPLALFIDGPPVLPDAAGAVLAIAYVSIPGTALAYLLYYRVLRVAGSGNAMLVTLMIPPVAIVLGALVLGERIGLSAFAGFALLALGLALIDGRLVTWLRRGSGRRGPAGRSS